MRVGGESSTATGTTTHAETVPMIAPRAIPRESDCAGVKPSAQGAADLELLECRTLDGHTQELIYRPTRH